jgi:hypothetical protein
MKGGLPCFLRIERLKIVGLLHHTLEFRVLVDIAGKWRGLFRNRFIGSDTAKQEVLLDENCQSSCQGPLSLL